MKISADVHSLKLLLTTRLYAQKKRLELRESTGNDHVSRIMRYFYPFLYFLNVLHCSLMTAIKMLFFDF